MLRVFAAVLAVAALLGAVSPAAEAQTAHYIGQPGVVQASGSSNTFASPFAVFVDSTETYAYVADTGNQRIVRITINGGAEYVISQYSGSNICSNPEGVIADSVGNVYFTCADTTTIYKETFSGGTYSRSVFYNGVVSGRGPRGMAIDLSNNIYVAVQYNGTGNQAYVLKCTTSGSCSTFYTFPANGSSSSNAYEPQGIAVDNYGNLFISDISQQVVFKLSGTTLTNIQSCTAQVSPWSNGCFGVAVDSSGVVYSSSNGPVVYKATPNGGGYTNSTIYTAPGLLHRSVGIALNPAGTMLYAADFTDGNQNLGYGVTGPSPPSTNLIRFSLSGQGFGSVPVGSAAGNTITFTFQADTAGTVGSVAVLTQGSTGLDFGNAGTGTCTAGSTLSSTCTVNVTFTPTQVGLRTGAVVLKNSSGTPFATAFVYGTGTGPLVNYPSAVAKTIDPSITGAEGLVSDPAGNLYIVGNNTLYKETYNAGTGTYTRSTLATSAAGTNFNALQGLAIDGAGNLYLGDGANSRIVKEVLSGGTFTPTVICNSGCGANEVAVDAAGNVYFLSGATSAVEMLTMVQNSSGISYSGPVNIQSNNNNPWGVAVDSLGNVFYTTAASSSGQSLYKLTPAGGQYSQTQLDSTLGDPVNIALDMQGNVYIAQDLGATSSIVKETFSSNTTYTKSTVASNISNAVGVWVDASGNLFYTSQGSGALYEIPYGTPPSLTFANTNEGATTTTTTSGTNPVTLQNVGTAPFTLEVPSTGTNPSVSANFSATGTTNCNLLSTNSSIESLSAGSTCNLTVTFAPATGGSISGSLVLLDNNLNAGSPNYTTQTIPLSGTGVWLTPTVTSVSPSVGPITGGTTVTIGGTYLAGATGVSFGGTAGTIVTDTSTSMTVTSPVVSSVGPVDVTVTTPGGTSVTSANDKFTYQAMPTVTLAMSYNGNTVGTGGSVASGNALKLTATVKVGTNAVYPGIVAFCNAAASRCTDVDLLGTAELTTAGTASVSFVPGIGSYSYKAVFLPTGDVFTATSSTSTLTVTAASTQPTTTTINPATGSAGNYSLSATVTSTGVYPTAGPTGTVNFLDTTNSNANVGPSGVGATLGTPSVSYGFANATSIATGTGPQREWLFDYNNDGKLDLAVANTGGNTVTVYTGNGNGTFNSTAVATLSTTDPTSITAGDFNGDGYPDLAVASYGGYTVAIYTGNGSGTFTLKQTITLPSSSQPLWISIGDFNNDGVLDFVTTSQATNAAHVYLGNGDGTFTLKTTLTFSSFPTTSALGDFNGDGKLDMAIPVISSGTVAIYLGNGDGTFTLKQSPSVGTNPHGAVAADFNGDGILDLAVANNGSASVTVLQGAGDGTFTTSATLTVPANPDLLSVGDFNGDGIPDIVVGNTTTTVLTGSAQGSFTSTSLATALGQVLTGDLNGDGLSDIVGLSGSTAVTLLAQRTWTATATESGVAVAGTGTHTIDASYIGDTNYAASTSSGTVSLTANALPTVILLGVNPSGPQAYGTSVTLTASVSPTSAQGHAVTGDSVTFKSDGTTVAGCGNAVLNSSGQAICTTSALPGGLNSLTAVFNSSGSDVNFATSTSTPLNFGVTNATPAINLTVSSSGSVSAGTAVTLTATVSSGGSAVAPGLVKFCDMVATFCTGTHLLGIVEVNGSGTASLSYVPLAGSHSYQAVFLGNTYFNSLSSATTPLTVTGINVSTTTTITPTGTVGAYTLTATVTGGTGATVPPSGTVTFQDTNNGNYPLGTPSLVPSTTGPSFASSSLTTGSTPVQVATGDFNGDGLLDIAVVNANANTLYVYLATGAGTYGSATSYSTGLHPQAIAVGDFNGDGIPDLAVVNNYSTTVGIFLGSSTNRGRFGSMDSYSSANGPQALVVGDFNGDGIQDIAVSTTAAVSFLPGTGSSTAGSVFGTATNTSLGNPYTGQGIAALDYNNDGYLDLAVACNNSTGKVLLLRGSGTGTFTLGSPLTAVSEPYAIVAGDFNNDGYADLAVTNYGSTSVSVFLNNGSGGFGAVSNYAAGANASTGIVTGDFNGDGISDLVLSNFGNGSTSLSLLLGTTSGTFPTVTSISAGGTQLGIASGDLNNDGLTDLVTLNSTSTTARVLLTQPETATAMLSGVSIVGTGSHLVNASYGGDTNYAASLSANTSLNAAPLTTTTTLTANQSSPISYGTSVTLTATVSPTSAQNHTLAGETMIFYSGSTALCSNVAVNSSGQATCTTTLSAGGPYSLTAVYGGDTNFATSTSNALPFQVNQAVPSVTWATPSAITYGTQLSGTQLDATSPLQGNFVYSPAAGTVLSAGLHTLSVTFTPTGSGASNYTTSTVTVPLTVNQAATTTALTVRSGGNTVSTVTSGSEVTLTATVTANGGALTNGTVNFCNAAASYCTDQNLVGTAQLTLAGTASISLIPGPGSHSYKAVFEGSANGTGSSSGTSTLAVTSSLATTTTIAPSGSAGNYTLTATVTGPVIAAAVQPVTVSFLDTTSSNAVVGMATLGSETLSVSYTNPQSPGLPNPTFGVTGDFNGDGIPDMAFSSATANNVIIALGNGDGTFNVLTTRPTATQAYGIAAGDFNNDGKLDLAVTNYGNAAVTILLGNGDGTFTNGGSVAVGSYPWGIAVGDFNGDGNLDVVTTNIGANNVTVLLGNGDGTFTAASVSPAVGSFPTSASVGDFNGDGKLDIAVANFHATTVSILTGNGDGTFNAAPNVNVGSGPITVVAGDINGDGKLDLAVDNYSGNNITTYLGNGDGTFGAATATLNLPGNGAGMVLADLNGDGKLDLATEYSVTNFQTFQSTYTAAIYTGDGNGGFTLASTQTTGANPQWLLTGDWNGDGYADLAVENGTTATILLTHITESATATAMGVSPVGTGTHYVEASYPGDGHYAASVSGTTGLTAQQLTTTTSLAVKSGGNIVTTVAASAKVTLTATVLTGSTPMTSGTVNFCNANATHCTDVNLLGTAQLQLNGGGMASLSFYPGVGSYSYKAVYVANNSALGSVSTAHPLSVTGSAGNTNLATTTSLSASGSAGNYTLTATVTGSPTVVAPFAGTVSLLDTSNGNYSLGTPSFGASTVSVNTTNSATVNGGLDASALVVGDFNGDGKLDLAVGNYAYSVAYIYLGNGDGTFTATTQGSVGIGNQTFGMATADFNNDGKLDLASADNYDNAIGVVLGNGDGSFGSLSYAGGIGHPFSLTVGDFNGDGNVDIAAVNNSGNTVSVFLGNGSGSFTTVSSTPATGSGPAGIVAGDFNGDGIKDLAVANSGSNNVTILLGNGDGTFTAATVSPSTGNHPQGIAVADVNADGKLDLLVANYNDGTVTVLLGNGDGSFTAASVSPAVGFGPFSIALGDFNGDGIADLAVANNVSDTVSLLLGNGDGTFTATTGPSTDAGPQVVVAGDLNGDGHTDLATLNTRHAQAFLFTSLTETATAMLAGVSPVGTGTHNVEASYPGDSHYAASVSSTVGLTAQAVATTLTLTPSPTGSTYGQQVTLTATLAPYTAQGHSADGEAISFYNGSTLLGTANMSSGSASIMVSTLPAGTDGITATFAGDTNFASSNATINNYSVAQATKTITFPAPTTPVAVNSTATLTAYTSNGDPVTYSITAGSATISGTTITFTNAGPVTIAANSASTANYAVATTVSRTVIVSAAATSYAAPTTAVGATSATQTATINIATAGTLGTIYVVTQGASGLDYNAVNGGTCTTGTAYTIGQACTVEYSFRPLYPGRRLGGILLFDNSSTPVLMGESLLHGTGTGPQALFSTPVATTLATGFTVSRGVSVDGSGNVYLAESSADFFDKISPSGAVTQYPTSGLPTATAVDGAGNVFVASQNYIYEMPFRSTTLALYASGVVHSDNNLVVDSSGNLYITQNGTQCLYKFPAGSPNSYSILFCSGTYVSGVPTGRLIATTIDANGNLYLSDFTHSRVLEVAAGTSTPTVAVSDPAIYLAQAVAVDPAGDLYVATANGLNRYPYANGSYGSAVSLTSYVASSTGAAMGADGTLYLITDSSLYKYVRTSTPALSFGSVADGSTSAQQVVGLENDGNVTALTISSLTAGNIYANFNGAGTTCSTSTPLATGGVCNLGVEFAPTGAVSGVISGTAVVSDNSLNANGGAAQVLNITGTAVANVPTVSVSSITVVPGSTAGITVTATASGSAGSLSGAVVTFSLNGNATGSFSPSNCTLDSTGTCTTSYVPTGTLALGTYTNDIQASFGVVGNYASATATSTLTVAQLSTSTTLAVTSGGNAVTTVAQGAVVTLTATVSNGGTAIYPGTVNFCNANATDCLGLHLLGTAQLNSSGVASISLRPGAGSYSYKAVYVATVADATSSSSSQPLTVTGTSLAIPYVTTTAISQSGSAGNYSLTATVTGVPGAFTPLTGSVSFLDATNGNFSLSSPVTLGPSTPGFSTTVSANPVGGGFADPSAILLGDFNHDGKLDAALNNIADGSLTFYLGNGDGTFTRTAFLPFGSQPYQMVAGDFNNDGNPDIATGLCYGSGVSVVLGNGDGTFGSSHNFGTGDCVEALAEGDFNGDGNLDLIAANRDHGTMSVLLGNGNGGFTAAQATVPTGNAPSGVAVGDFNGDGQLDFATANYGDNTVTVALGNGDGTFTVGTPVAVGREPQGIGVADFNGDGNLDIVVSNVADGTVSVLLGDGHGAFATPSTVSVGNSPQSLAVGDLDGDGHADIVTGNYSGNTLSLLLGNGDGTFTAAQSISAAHPVGVMIGDLNGDGQLDLFVDTPGTSNSTALLLTGKTETATATAMGISPVGTGTHNVEASYPGDSHYAAGISATTGLTAQPVTTNVTLIANPSASTYGQQVTLTATLVPYTAQGHSTDGEPISFYNGSTLLGTANLSSGTASFPVSTLPAGNDNITASYTADGNFASSSVGITNYNVAQAAKNITFPALTTPVAVNSTATLAAFTSNGDPVTYSITSGSATISGTTITFTTAGNVTIAADSASTSNYAAATTVSQTIAVNLAPGSSIAPTTPVGSISATQTATVNVLQGGTLNSIAVVTQGATGLDYNAVIGGTCTLGQPYTLDQACTVEYTFSPRYPWQRDGGIQLVSTGGAVMGRTYLTGTGTGPQIAFGPATAAIGTLANGGFGGSVLDASGNLFLTDTVNGSIMEVPFNAGVYGSPVTLATGFSSPQGVAIDGVGTLYVADSGHNAIKKIVYINGAYGAVSTLVSGLSSPHGVAVDGNGNLFFADTGNNEIKELPRSLAGSPSVLTLVNSGLSGPTGIAIDGNGNLFFADTGNNQIDELSYTNGSFGSVTTIAGSGLSGPQGVAVDAAGNVYFADTGNNQIDELPLTGGTYGSAVILPSSTFAGPQGIAVDSADNLYIADTGHTRLAKLDIADSPSLTFPSTNDGSTSPTQSVTVTNNGNAALVVAAATASSSFTRLTTGGPFTDCLLTASVATGANCSLNLAFNPTSPQNGTINGTASLSDNSLNVLGASQTLSLTGFAVGSPVVTGISPAFGPAAGGTQVTLTGSQFTGATAVNFGANEATNVTVGSDSQITATAPAGTGTVDVTVTTAVGTSSTSSADRFLYQIPQTITFVPASPVIFGVSPIALTATGGASGNPVTFTLVSGPATLAGNILTVTGAGTIVVSADQAGNSNYTAAPTVTANIVVNQATPVLTWATPAGITYGTALSSTQLNATSSVAGTFVYTPAIGAVPAAGTDTLSVTFTPTDTADYTTATATVQLAVGKATPALTWATPAGITYGTALSSTQLDATSSVAGTFVYTPAIGAVPAAGTDTLSVTFTPTDTADYTTATATVQLAVGKATPALTWATPAGITYGTALSATQLDATSSVAGSFVYTPAIGAVPAAGTDTLSVTFTPTDTADYTTATATVQLAVGKATPALTWATPAGITYGTALSATQLDATSSVAGSFVYTPAIGAVPAAGTDTLSVTFTPTDTADYTTATATVQLVVGKATPALTWATPAGITYGTALSATQLDATSSVAGSFVYTPAIGAVPAAGTDTLSVTFTPTDTADYTTATATVQLAVGKATPALTWATPAGITYGTALSATQLDATSSVAGSFVYTPAIGAVPAAGTDTLSVTFTPTDTADYTTATATVQLAVGKATPVLSWATPAGITYGTALSATQLDATSSVAGTFVYTPALGSVLTAGTDTLSVTFTPTDTADYTTATATVQLAVGKATPALTWATPAGITYGTALSATQLDASSSVAGTFVYTPAIGAVPAAGTDTLSVTFTPTDTADYTTATATVQLAVGKATPVLSWATPAGITYGTALSATQLDATSSVAGTFVYTPALGSVLTAGTDTLSVTFTPTDTADYTTATATVQLAVGKATPMLTWATPAGITYGTALSATQLDASSSVAGTFVYTPALGSVLTAGTDTLFVTFTPTDTANYTTAMATVQLAVGKATPVLTWATPSGITYGTALSATQLDATSSVAGTFVYTPALGSVLTAGTDTLSVTFTPTDTADYTTATATVQLVVGKATPTLTWATPAGIAYGTALSATQLDASSSVAGTFVYTPAIGAVLAAGTDTLSVTFTPTDTADYTTATATVQLAVGKTTPMLTLMASANPVFVQNPVTLTAVASAPTGVPTGTVTFLDGTTVLGSVSLSGGSASFTTSSLSVGPHTLSASYGGDTAFNPQVSASIAEQVQDFGFNLTSNSDQMQQVVYGGSASYNFAISPASGQTFAAPIAFTVTGLPAGATATFSPKTLPAGSAGTDVIMTVTLPVQLVKLRQTGSSPGVPALAFALLLLPFAAMRSRARKLKGLLCMALLLAGGASAALFSGCAGGGYVQPRTYTLTVTATSGTLSHSTTVTLLVE